jgi:hypothetical protein
MLLSRYQNVGQNRDIKIANGRFENVSQFRYLGTTVGNQDLIQEEIKRRLNGLNACYHSIHNLLSSRLLAKKLYWCETWSLTLREEHRLRVFENRVLRKIFIPKMDKVTGECRKLHNEELRDLYSSQSIIRIIKSRRMRWTGQIARMREKRNAYRLFAWKARGKETTRKTKT